MPTELLHLRVPNHGKLFKALMNAHVPDWKTYDAERAVSQRRESDMREPQALDR